MPAHANARRDIWGLSLLIIAAEINKIVLIKTISNSENKNRLVPKDESNLNGLKMMMMMMMMNEPKSFSRINGTRIL